MRNAPYAAACMMVKETRSTRCDGHGVFVARGGEEAGRGRTAFRHAGRGQLPATPNGLRVSAAALGGFQDAVRGGGRLARELGRRALEAVDRRHEGARERDQAKAMRHGRMQHRNGAWSARSRGCSRRRGTPTRRTTRASGRTSAATTCRRSCAAGRLVWKRSAAKARLEAAQRGGRRARAASGPGSESEGRAAVQARVWSSRTRRRRATSRRERDRRRAAEGFQPCYNAHYGGGREHQLVVRRT